MPSEDSTQNAMRKKEFVFVFDYVSNGVQSGPPIGVE